MPRPSATATGRPLHRLPALKLRLMCSSITGRKFDVAKAKQLLTEAGYPNGFKTKIIAQDNADQNVLVTVQSNLAKVGITAELQIVQAAAMTGIQASGWNNGVLFIQLGFEGNIIPTMGFNFPPVRTGRYKNVANYTQVGRAL